MPHGVRSNRAGTRVYVSCMHSDEILELDVGTLKRRPTRLHRGRRIRPAATARRAPPPIVSVAPDDRRLYVACNTANTLQVWDAASLTRVGELPAGKGAYNVEPSPDGRLVLVTNKKDRSVSIVDAASLKEIARVPTSKPVVHGIAFSPDSRVAYISCESIGSDPGAVDMIDLATRKVVASIPVPGQPTGIAVGSLRPANSTH